MGLFHLASHLNKTVSELEDMPVSEYFEWGAYLNLEAEKRGS